jgi:hypothetical protein
MGAGTKARAALGGGSVESYTGCVVRCFFCPGVAHPSTGSEYSPRVVACRECTVTFALALDRSTWIRGVADAAAVEMKKAPSATKR